MAAASADQPECKTPSVGGFNRLQHAQSPYLRQHASNPVDWYEWGDEAFQEARRRGCPILLSVGYHSCHWCGVMERECFENPAIAKLMNAYFVNVKVDRQERPDVDSLYMSYVSALTGHGGWPMTVWLTPDLQPIFGGTYFPPTDRPGMPGLPTLMKLLHSKWLSDREEIERQGAETLEQLKSEVLSAGLGKQLAPDRWEHLRQNILSLGLKDIAQTFDPKFGGTGNHPKFPTAVTFDFLLFVAAEARRQPLLDPEQSALSMVLLTLRKMRHGGIFDHVGHGFFRYSVTRDWFIPHFEKMIYVQSQLAETYLQAYLLTEDEELRDVVRETLNYTLAAPVSLPEGCFVSAESADSMEVAADGSPSQKEGAFYVWRTAEINEHVQDPELFRWVFGVVEGGNVPKDADPHGELSGKNHVQQVRTFEQAAERFGRDIEEVKQSIRTSLAALEKHRRATREAPPCDDQALTGWNALMISALAKAGAHLNEPEYVEAALKCCAFIREHLYDAENNRLRRSWRHGVTSPYAGFADDYAYMIRALLDLYEATFDPAHLQWALKLQERFDAGFWDHENQHGYLNAEKDADASLLLRTLEREDGACPAPSSVAVWNLLRLNALLHVEAFAERADAIMRSFSELISMAPGRVCPLMSSALAVSQRPFRQCVLQGDPKDPNTVELLRTLRKSSHSNLAIVAFDGGSSEEFFRKVSEDLNYFPTECDVPRVFVCQNFTCEAPVSSAAQLAEVLRR